MPAKQQRREESTKSKDDNNYSAQLSPTAISNTNNRHAVRGRGLGGDGGNRVGRFQRCGADARERDGVRVGYLPPGG